METIYAIAYIRTIYHSNDDFEYPIENAENIEILDRFFTSFEVAAEYLMQQRLLDHYIKEVKVSDTASQKKLRARKQKDAVCSEEEES